MANNGTSNNSADEIDSTEVAAALMKAARELSKNSVLLTQLHEMFSAIEPRTEADSIVVCMVRMARQLVDHAASDAEEMEEYFRLEADRYS